jgi:ferritin
MEAIVTLPQTLADALNDQIRDEFYASHLYLSMAAYFEEEDLPGFAHWMRLQSDEERAHALRLFEFVSRRRSRVRLQAIEQPPADFASPLAAVEAAFAHEQLVTGRINQLYELAMQERDYPTHVELQWFIMEQVEEEESAQLLVQRTRVAGDDPTALLLLDGRLAERRLESGGETTA